MYARRMMENSIRKQRIGEYIRLAQKFKRNGMRRVYASGESVVMYGNA